MSTYHVEHSLNINRPIERVRSNLIDYRQWTKWSPWFIMEPDAEVYYNDKQGEVGASYTWRGLLIGEGRMELLEVKDYSLNMELTFEKPFKSKAIIHFSLEELDDSTVVHCMIEGKLPLYMFWIKSKMKAIMSVQYEHGLHMFKEYLEEGTVVDSVHIEGILPVKRQRYIGIPRVSTLQDVRGIMKKDFATLSAFMEKNNISKDTIPFSIYKTFDFFGKKSSFISCIPIHKDVEIDDTWTKGTIDKQDALKTKYKGSYTHLRNVWMAALNFAGVRNIKRHTSPLGYEFYASNPLTTPKSELVTEIYLPLK